ncbi:alpha-L-rhamnosidase [Cohnella fermenti]|uniref:alpha-L-rhamnosidase n=1 Tax=Cohnella fermenti TaxID=2565925 RepID=A0A4S4BV88_9BACL|nr:alpha-L-rhamnosidase [Cohnella fermenti]THF76888.1 hypothetical protein E6C55_17650 [Cohnella fermenti]
MIESNLRQARWIACGTCDEKAAPLFRKSVRLPGKAKEARLRISGLGFYVLKINGRRLGNELLQPAFTSYDKTVLFNRYDVLDYLIEGDNKFEVKLGNGWYNECQPTAWEFQHALWRDRPKFILELELDGRIALVSDSSWECAASATLFNSLRCGETYDAAYRIEHWEGATVVPAPGGILKEQAIPPIRLRETYPPVRIVPSPTPVIYDFGVNLSGNVQIKVSGRRGSRVILQYFEALRTTATPDLERYKQHVYEDRFQRDEYILSGEGDEVWHSEFGYNGFRYVRVYGDYDTIEVMARCFHTDLADAGGLSCDHPLVNRIQAAVRRSTLTNFHHLPTDCPHREKNGWTADAHLACEQALFNFDMRDAYIKWLDDLVDCQLPGGRIPCIAPTSTWGYDRLFAGPAWDAALFVIPWQLYRYTGDVDCLRRYHEPMARYVDYLQSILEDGICRNGLGDWSAPPNAAPFPRESLLTAYSYCMADLYGRISGLLQDKMNERKGSELAAAIRVAFRSRFVGMPCESQTFYAIMLYFDLVAGEEKDYALKRLLETIEQERGHLVGGIFCAKMLLDVLTEHGHIELAYRIASQEDFPGWGYMTKLCAGTLGENWFGGSSMNHPMFSEIGAWYYKALAGFRIDDRQPGFRHIRIAPYSPADIGRFSAWHRTPFGRLELGWDEENLILTLPQGITATFEYGHERHELSSGVYRYKRQQ